MPPATIGALLQEAAASGAGAPKILAPGRTAMTAAELVDQAGSIAALLREAGIGPGQRVAMVMPAWGPATEVAGIAIAAASCLVLLNPEGTSTEARHLMSRLECRALVTLDGWQTTGRAAAMELGVRVLELQEDPAAGAGAFQLTHPAIPLTGGDMPDGADDAWIFSTTGSTGRPKLMAMSQAAFADMIGTARSLTRSGSRNAVLMSVHTAMGLYYPLRTIVSGGGVFFAPSFDVQNLLGWLAEYQVTAYTGNAVVHQALLDVAKQQPDVAAACVLEEITHVGTPIAAEVVAGLESTFRCGVRVVYGMAEAGAIAVVPPGQAAAKPGSVGRPVLDLRIVGEDGEVAPQGEVGEIQVSGPRVISGYIDDPEANAASFVDGWFRTGDLGFLDPDGWLTVSGRIKEQINRGGLKVSPHEVEEALATHPAVADCAVFPVPHKRMGEEVGAAVVLRGEVSAGELRAHAMRSLAPYKVPRLLTFVDEIPRINGKIPRLRLAAVLGIGAAGLADRAPSRELTDTERRVASIWRSQLELAGDPGPDDDYFELGGDSLMAIEMILAVEAEFRTALPQSALIVDARLAAVAATLDGGGSTACLVPIQRDGDGRPPLVWIHDGPGTIFLAGSLSFYLGPSQPVYAIQPIGASGQEEPPRDLNVAAQRYVEEICAVLPGGEIWLGGHSMGGTFAAEVARQLIERGGYTPRVLMVDTIVPSGGPPTAAERWRGRVQRLRGLPWRERGRRAVQYLRRRARGSNQGSEARQVRHLQERRQEWGMPAAVIESMHTMIPVHRPRRVAADVVFFRARESHLTTAAASWMALCDARFEVVDIDGTHADCVRPPHIEGLAAAIGEVLDRSRQTHLGAASQAVGYLGDAVDEVHQGT